MTDMLPLDYVTSHQMLPPGPNVNTHCIHQAGPDSLAHASQSHKRPQEEADSCIKSGPRNKEEGGEMHTRPPKVPEDTQPERGGARNPFQATGSRIPAVADRATQLRTVGVEPGWDLGLLSPAVLRPPVDTWVAAWVTRSGSAGSICWLARFQEPLRKEGYRVHLLSRSFHMVQSSLGFACAYKCANPSSQAWEGPVGADLPLTAGSLQLLTSG